MVKKCCVKSCKSESYGGCGISFYSFPNDGALRNVWVAAAGREPETTNFNNATICSNHFEERCFKRSEKLRYLLSGSVPTKFVQTPGPVQEQSMPVPNDAAEQATRTGRPRLVESIKVTSGPSLKCQGKISHGPNFNPVITAVKSEADLLKQEGEDPQSDDTLSLAEDADQLSDADQPSEDLIPLSNAQIPLSNAPDPLSDVKVEEVVIGMEEVEVTRPMELTTPVELSRSMEEAREVEESAVTLPLHFRQDLAPKDSYKLIKQADQINKLTERCDKQRRKLHCYSAIVRRREEKISNLRAELEALRGFIRECGWEVGRSVGGKMDVRRVQIRSPNTVVGQKKPNRQLLIVKRDYKPLKSSVSAQRTSHIQTSTVDVKRKSDIKTSTVGVKRTSDIQTSTVGVKRTSDIQTSTVGVKRTSDIQTSTVGVKRKSDIKTSTVGVKRTSDIQTSTVGVKRTSDIQTSTVGVKRTSDIQTSTVGVKRKSDIKTSTVGVKRTSDIQTSTVGVKRTSDIQTSTVGVRRTSDIQEKSSVSIPGTSDVVQKSSVVVKRILNNPSIAVQPKSVVPQTSSVGFQRTSDVRQNALVIQIDGMHNAVLRPKLVRLDDNSVETG